MSRETGSNTWQYASLLPFVFERKSLVAISDLNLIFLSLNMCVFNAFPSPPIGFFCYLEPPQQRSWPDKSFFSSYMTLTYFCTCWKVSPVDVISAIFFVYQGRILSEIIPKFLFGLSELWGCCVTSELIVQLPFQKFGLLRRWKNLTLSPKISIKERH